MAFVASSIASSRCPLAKETPAWVNNSSALFSAARAMNVAKNTSTHRANKRASNWKIIMGNGYRAPQDGASDLGRPGEEIRMPNDERNPTPEISEPFQSLPH